MAGYLGSRPVVVQVDGYQRTEAESRYVNVSGDDFTGHLDFTDDAKARFGSSDEMHIYTESSGSGYSYIQGDSIVLRKANQSTNYLTALGGVVSLMHSGNTKLATTSTGVDVTGTVTADGINSSGNFAFTTADGMTISAKETVSINIDSDDNDSSRAFTVTSGGSGSLENLIVASEDAGVTLYYDNSAKLATSANGVSITGNATFADNGRAQFGAGTELEIYSNGTVAYMDTAQLIIANAGHTENIAKFIENGAVELYHDNVLKLTTASGGINVTGTVTSTGNITAGSSTAGVVTVGSANGFEMQKSGVNGYINQSDSGPIIIRMGSSYSERLRLTTDGNLGIGGTPATNTKLLVKAGTNLNFEVENSSSNLRLSALNDARSANVGMQFASSSFQFLTGNVGIGTTSPDSLLNIEATKTTALSSMAHFLTLGLTVDDDTAYNNAGIGGGIAFRGIRDTSGNQTVYGAIDAGKEDTANGSYKGSLRFYTNNNSTGVPTEHMRIDSSGNVTVSGETRTTNINTASSTGTLTMYGGATNKGGTIELSGGNNTGATGSGIVFKTGASTSSPPERMRIDNEGRVGIANDTPGDFNASGDDLVIGNSSGNRGITIRSGTSNSGNLFFADGLSGDQLYRGFIQYQHSGDKLVLGAGGDDRVFIDGSGAVTKPSQPAFSVHKNGTDQSNFALNTDVTVTWSHSRFDQNSDFDFVNGRFTAPVTGKYQLNGNILLESLDAAADYYIVYLHTSNNKYRFIFDPDLNGDKAYWSVAISVLADMDANDIASIVVNQGGGTQQTDIEGSAEYTTFSGYLVA